MMPQDLRIIYFNCNSIISKLDEILDFLLEFDIDVAMFSETYLKNRHKFELSGYHMLRKDEDNNRHGGGIAIAIKLGIDFQQINVPHLRTLPHVLAAKLVCNNSEPVVVAATYIPNNILRVDKRDLAVIFRIGDKVALAGDMNARHRIWGCQTGNARGESINEFIIQHGGRIHIHFPIEPTYFPYDVTRNPSTIDLCLTKGLQVRTRPESMPRTDSDHNIVKLNIIIDSPLRRYDCNYYQYSKANWPLYEAHMIENINCIQEVTDQETLDNAVDDFTNIMRTGQSRAVPKWKTLPEELPSYIIEMRREKNRLRRQSQHAATPTDMKRRLKSQINQLSVMIRNAIANHRNTLLRRKISNYRQYDNNIHFHAREILDEKQPIPPLTADNVTFYSETAKANLLAEKFEGVFHQNDDLGSQ